MFSHEILKVFDFQCVYIQITKNTKQLMNKVWILYNIAAFHVYFKLDAILLDLNAQQSCSPGSLVSFSTLIISSFQ